MSSLKFAFYILVLTFAVFPANLFAQPVYQYEVIASVAVSADQDIYILGRGPSINNQGKVAFMSKAESAQGHIILSNGGTPLERHFPIAGPFRADEYVQVNDADQIIFWEGTPGDIERCFGLPCFSNLNRLDTQAGGESFARGALIPVPPPLEQPPFELLLPWGSLNDSGRGMFGVDTNGLTRTMLATRVGGVGPHTTSPFLPDLPKLFPMLSNDNRTVVRMGLEVTSPIVLWLDETLTVERTLNLAIATNFNVMGRMSGISDDGRVMAFMAKDKNNDAGIYVAAVNPQGRGVTFKLIDIPDNSYMDSRAAINLTGNAEKPFEYRVAYLANSPSNSKFGLYTVDVDVSNPFAPVISPPTLLAEVDQRFEALDSNIVDLEIYDPVNTRGQIAFWIRTSSAQAIVRATPGQPAEFRRADPNNDGSVNIADVMTILEALFRGGPLVCADAADANDDGEADVSDAIYTLLYLFAGGKPPAAPFPDPGVDPTQDNTGCGP